MTAATVSSLTPWKADSTEMKFEVLDMCYGMPLCGINIYEIEKEEEVWAKGESHCKVGAMTKLANHKEIWNQKDPSESFQFELKLSGLFFFFF